MVGIYIELGRGTGREGEVLKLAGRRFLVGRAGECEIRFQTDVVSRRHAEFRFDGAQWILVDLDSRNGTFLNQQAVAQSALRPLDALVFGEGLGAQVRVLSLDPAPPMETEPGEDPTRYLRVKPRSRPPPLRRKHPEYEEPPLVRPLPPETQPPALPPARSIGFFGVVRIFHPLTVVGMAFGLLTAWEIWGTGFPYVAVAAPALWGMRAIHEVLPDVVLSHGDWLLRFLLALWFGVIGLTLERPLGVRSVLLIVLGALHVIAALACDVATGG